MPKFIPGMPSMIVLPLYAHERPLGTLVLGSRRRGAFHEAARSTLEVLASDHAPHCEFQKEVEFDYAPFGILGFETEVPLSLMQLVHRGHLSLSQMIEKFTVNPAKLLRLPSKGHLSIGADGDVTILDPTDEWIYDRFASASLSKNSPFHDWPMKGRAVATIVRGNVVWRL